MDKVIDLPATVQSEVEAYVAPLFAGTLIPVADHQRQIYAVLAIPDASQKFKPGIVLLARVEGDTVYIDVDATDRPLVNELVRAGIPREQIVLRYAGEPVPASQ